MKNQRKVFQSLTLILQFGLNMIVPIVMCTLLGAWLGKKIRNAHHNSAVVYHGRTCRI